MIPSVTPRGRNINMHKELKDFITMVSDKLKTIITRTRDQEEEYKEAERARIKEAEKPRQEQLAQATR